MYWDLLNMRGSIADTLMSKYRCAASGLHGLIHSSLDTLDANLYYWEGVDILVNRGMYRTGLESFTTHEDGVRGMYFSIAHTSLCAENIRFDFGHELYPYNANTPLNQMIMNECWYRLNCACGLFRTAPNCLLLTTFEIQNVRTQMMSRREH